MLTLLVVATAVMIYCFSSQNAVLSSETSGRVTRFLLRVLIPGFDGMTAGEQQALISRYSPAVRKLAHFSEFFLLGLFLRLLLQRLPVKGKTALSWIGGTAYAVTDELHQMAVGGRAAMALDVGIDSLGALAGTLTALLLGALSGKIAARRNRNPAVR